MKVSPLTSFLGVILLLTLVQDSLCQISEPRLKCTRCPLGCTSSQKVTLSCHNACRSYNTNLTVVNCVDGMCQCRYPNSTTTASTKNVAGKMLQSHCLVMCCLIITLAVMSSTLATQSIYATNPRPNRGFKGQSISTARGFGKRGDRGYFAKTSFIEPINGPKDAQQSDDTESRYPNDWLVEEIQRNPEMAKVIVDRIIDQNRDGELAPEELFNKVYY